MKRVMIESPFAAISPSIRKTHGKYLEACILDSLERGEAPFASHGFYTNYLSDDTPTEREQGILCGQAWAEAANIVAFYVDYGISPGMLKMLEWIFERIQVRTILSFRPEIRRIPNWFDEKGKN